MRAGTKPEEKNQVAGKTEEHGEQEKGSDRAPDVREQKIGGKERDNDKQIESAKKELLLTEGVGVGSAPVWDGPAPGSGT